MAEQEALAPEAHVNPIVHLIAPIVAIAATMIVRKVITSSIVGLRAEKPHELTMPLCRSVKPCYGRPQQRQSQRV